jgi:hypothetical protein
LREESLKATKKQQVAFSGSCAGPLSKPVRENDVKKGRRGSSIRGSHSCRWVQVPLSDSGRLSSAL